MAKDPQDTYEFLSRTYRVVKLVALTSVSIAGLLVSVVALDIKVSHWWVDVKVPLYGLVLVATPIVVLYTVAVVGLGLLLKDNLGALSFYKSKSKNLEAAVSTLKDLAYHDPITGIPNSNALKQEIERTEYTARCLILLDLQNFGEINKRHNHWVGDEYLRKFSQMVTSSGRRNEFLFKKRPLSAEKEKNDGPMAGEDDVKAFRRNSGGDEFFILLEGTVVDGLGYLNRLQKRANDFEQMAVKLMGGSHPFGFHAGLVSIAHNESFDSVSKRVSGCLGVTIEEHTPRRVYWMKTDEPERLTDLQKSVVEDALKLFLKPNRTLTKNVDSDVQKSG